MTTPLDAKLVPKAKELIEKFGKTMTLTVEAPGTYDPVTGTVPVTPTSETLKCSPPLNYQSRFVDGEIIRAGDVRVLIPAQGLTIIPKVDMKVEFDGEIWNAISVDRVFSGDDIALWKTQLRK